MTERAARHVRQSPERFEVGPSALHWTGDALEITFDELSTPHLQRIRGRVRVMPEGVTEIEVPLHGARHIWRPYAPVARIEVAVERPGWEWTGHGYFDANFGTAALEADFSYWTWARLPVRGGTASFYDATRRDGSALAVALKFGADGAVSEIEAPPMVPFHRGFWQVRRAARSEAGCRPRQVQAMLDAPFYNRSAIRTKVLGEETVGVHEALDLDRL
ncbi:MAG: carotenoid 1,2-hydratase, partial [Pseudomonadota bacterium]